MRKYEEYKDVELRYFESIPVNWKLGRLCDVLSSKNYSFTGGPFGSDLKSNDYTDDGIRIIQLQNIGVGKFLNDYKIYTSEDKANALLACNIYPGDIIIAKMADPVARATIIPDYHSRYLMASDGIRLVNNNFNDSRFLVYAINSIHFNFYASINSVGSTRQRIGLNVLKKLNIILPTLQEQQAIANYLDAKTQAIDKKVTLLEQKIETYKKLKRTLINQTITKGLDKNVPLKDSGISWIGQIPQHWGVKRLKDYFKFSKGKNAAFYNQVYVNDSKNYGEYPVYSGQTENSGLMASINTFEYNCKDDVYLVTTVGAKAMELKIVKGKFTLSQNCALIEYKKNKDLSKYNFYYLTQLFKEERKIIPTIMQPSLRIEDLDKYFLIHPPKSEQEEIAQFLDQKTATIDAIVSNIGKQIETLKQLRKTLINDVVTGKIKVVE